MINKYNKGFTLIELLVVIAIIALLSSVVLATVSTSREKARIASAKEFSSMVTRTLGSEAISMYSMNEGGGTTLLDGANGLHNGTLNSGVTFVQDTPWGKGFSLSFSGNNRFVNIKDDINDSLNRDADNFTVSLWIKPADDGVDYFLLNKYWNGSTYSYNFVRNADGTLSLQMSKYYNKITKTVNKVPSGRWSHVAFTANTNNDVAIYIDGKKAAFQNYTGSDETPIGARQSLDLILGSQYPGGHPTYSFNGLMNSVQIFRGSIIDKI